MSLTFKAGHLLQGRLGCYSISRQLEASVWLAIESVHKRRVIVKYADHWRIRNERDVLLRFQERTPYVRPLLDEDLLRVIHDRQLTRDEVKHVGKCVLEALRILHKDGFVHTDVKPSNILVNTDHTRSGSITNVTLADLEATVPKDSKFARDGEYCGTPIFRSPEVHLNMPWSTSTDIWSFGATLISLIFGRGFHIFSPGVPIEDDEYDVKILRRHHEFFGPFPESYDQIADQESIRALVWIMESTPTNALKPFSRAIDRELCEEDKRFILRMVKLDHRDRPTTTQLLDDEWFSKPKTT